MHHQTFCLGPRDVPQIGMQRQTRESPESLSWATSTPSIHPRTQLTLATQRISYPLGGPEWLIFETKWSPNLSLVRPFSGSTRKSSSWCRCRSPLGGRSTPCCLRWSSRRKRTGLVDHWATFWAPFWLKFGDARCDFPVFDRFFSKPQANSRMICKTLHEYLA